ncbi:MAG: DNA repair protein RecO [Casimicrobiaceae bacterium]
MRAARVQHDSEPAWVLHARAYRETSLIVEAFGHTAGRIALVARGAKRPRSELRGLLQAFQPLALSWTGAGEIKTLVKAEWNGGTALPSGAALLSAFYLNELVLKLVPREDPHPALWNAYAEAVRALGDRRDSSAQAGVLRSFEVKLLAELGYAMTLNRDGDSGAPIDPRRSYHYAIDRGPLTRMAEPESSWPAVRGSTLIALASGTYPDPDTAGEAKRLMRRVLDHYLENRRIFSRRIVQDLAALDDEGDGS